MGARVARAANGGTVALVLITGIVATWVVLALVSVATWVGVSPVGGSANEVVATVERDEVAFGPSLVSTSTTLRRAVLTTPTTDDPGSTVADTGADRTIVVPAVPQTLPERVVAATIPPATATPVAPTTAAPATAPPTTAAPTTAAPATVAPTTAPPTTAPPTAPPTTAVATTAAPTTEQDTTTPPETETTTTVATTTTTVATTTTEAPTTTTTTDDDDDDDVLDRWCSFFPRSRWCD